jgi:hypothetical protein
LYSKAGVLCVGQKHPSQGSFLSARHSDIESGLANRCQPTKHFIEAGVESISNHYFTILFLGSLLQAISAELSFQAQTVHAITLLSA